MTRCPNCSADLPNGRTACARCGAVVATDPPTEADDPAAVGRADPTAVDPLPAPLPARMVEPIRPMLPEDGSSVIPGLTFVRLPAASHSGATAEDLAVTPSAKTVASRPSVSAEQGTLLRVVRGERLSAVYPLLGGRNLIGRSAEKPVDIDLIGQEADDQIWSSRQHAVIKVDQGVMVIEDLNSLNGTFVNRQRIHPGQQRELHPGDIVQVGTVQLRVEG